MIPVLTSRDDHVAASGLLHEVSSEVATARRLVKRRMEMMHVLYAGQQIALMQERVALTLLLNRRPSSEQPCFASVSEATAGAAEAWRL